MKKIKISIRLFIITIGLLLCIQIPSLATTGKSTASNLRIRKTPSTDGEVLEVLALEDKVEIIGEQGDWYNITSKGVTGYVSKSFITVEGNTQTDTNKVEENTNQHIDESHENEQNQEQNNNETPSTTEDNQQSSATEGNQTSSISENENNQIEPNKENTNKIYKISEDTQVHILPVLTSEIISQAKKDDNVTVLNNAGLWVYVQMQNMNGWIRIDKLSTENVTENDNSVAQQNNVEDNSQQNSTVEKNTTNQDTTEYAPKTMYVKATAVNIRSQSNTSADIVTSATINAEVKVINEENGWYKIEINGTTGYIRNDLVSDTKTEVSSRSNDIDRTTATTVPQDNNTVNQGTSIAQTNNTTAVPISASSSGVSGNDIVAYANQFLGYRYVYGAAGPNSFDCSGFTMYVYKHFGYSLSHSSKVQATQGKPVTGELQAGDILVFTNGGSTVGHVGIYIGNDKFIHASDSTTGVIISNLSAKCNKSKYVGARRIL